MSFTKEMMKTFTTATLGASFSQLLVRGISGSPQKADLVEIALNGCQCGVDFVAFPIAIKGVSAISEKFKKNYEDSKGNKYVTYIVGGAACGIVGATMKYPFQKALEKHQGKKGKCCAKELLSNMWDSIGGSIGFQATIGTFAPLFPKAKSNFMEWAQGHALIHISNLGATLGASPNCLMRYGVSPISMVSGWAAGIPATTFTNDFVAQFNHLIQ